MNGDRTKRSLDFPDDLYNWVVRRGTVADTFSGFVRKACRNQRTIEEKADAYAGDLPDGWWDDGLDRYLEWRRAHPEVAEEQDRDREEITHEAD